jgi:hypothetical protein
MPSGRLGDQRTWVRELGETNGRLHLHAVIESPFICYRCARGAVIRAGFGPVCSFERFKSKTASARYVSSYIAKGANDQRWRAIRNARRCQTSAPDFPRNKDWLFERLGYEYWRWQRSRAAYFPGVDKSADVLFIGFESEEVQHLTLTLNKKCVRAYNDSEVQNGFQARAGPNADA